MWVDCEVWKGSVNSSGYGPHRKLWVEKNGAIKDGYELHHACETKNCINLAHLELLTIAEHRQETVNLSQGIATHGTRRMYEGQKCSCDICRKANADRQRDFQRSKGRKSKTVAHHGTRSMYVKGCSCEDCKKASREYDRKRIRWNTPEERRAYERRLYNERKLKKENPWLA